MQPFIILINGVPTDLGGYLPASIQHFAVQVYFPVQLPVEQSAQLKQWLNSIIDRLDCDYVEFQNALIPTSDLKRF